MKYVLALLLVALCGCGGSGTSTWRVHDDGRIGPLRIDVSTEAQIRNFAGKPYKVQGELWPEKQGRTLYYRCGRHCETTYSISKKTGRLSDYWTQSPRFATEHGSRAGMTAARAARMEGKKPHPGCGFPRYIYLRSDDNEVFVLAIWKGKVDSIGYLGPHSIYYDGLC